MRAGSWLTIVPIAAQTEKRTKLLAKDRGAGLYIYLQVPEVHITSPSVKDILPFRGLDRYTTSFSPLLLTSHILLSTHLKLSHHE